MITPIFILLNLAKKLPELKNELKLCLEDQMDKYSKDFRKRSGRIILLLKRLMNKAIEIFQNHFNY